MLTIGAITFQTAAALWALLLLPIIWWLLRLTPPRPERVSFPPIRFLLGLIAKEETPHKTPWWLMLLRMLLIACLILAVARPMINRNAEGVGGNGPLLIVLDDGWAAAKAWPARLRTATEAVDRARELDQPVLLVTTTPKDAPPPLETKAAADVAETISTLQPKALIPDRMGLARRLAEGFDGNQPLDILWLSDGLDYGNASSFASALRALGGGSQVRALVPPASEPSLAVGAPQLAGEGLAIAAARSTAAGEQTVTARALAGNGRSLAEQILRFGNGETRATATMELPLQLRNEVARIDIRGERSAGAVYLLDDRWSRKIVGLDAAGSIEANQPLLSPLYYVTRALEPYAELRTIGDGIATETGSTNLSTALQGGLSMLMLADIGQLPVGDRDAVRNWVERGGILVRFAGPRLAAGHDDLVPVELREGDRALGGALTWEEPQPIAPFEEQSPFAGIPVSPEVTVAKQVLAQPTADLGAKVWARLADGTPLVTAERRGNGLIVLFHVTANADWSNLPLSGVFVEMLRRILDMAPGSVASGAAPESNRAAQGQGENSTAASGAGALAPIRVLNGFGELVDPPADARPIPLAAFDETRPGPQHPAGLYGRDSRTRALNLYEDAPQLTPIGTLPTGIALRTYQPAQTVSFAGPLLVLALILFLLDAFAVLLLSGSLGQLRSRFAKPGAALALGFLCLTAPSDLQAQTNDNAVPNQAFALESSLDTKLAYVRTGDSEVDQISEAGLTGLTEVLMQRTAVEAAPPVGVDIERDDIVFFPMLYWPVLPDAPALSPAASARVDAYLKNGGTILFDTRDHQSNVQSLAGGVSPATQALQRILANVNVPPLTPVPPEHVLTKAFYLLQTFPGRWAGGQLWVEAGGGATPEGSANFDGVSSVIIGANDYAAAWALNVDGQPMFPAVPGGARQREMALRSGVNIVMYVLTGNYKADQVHVPALLERLGQ
ncbi:DUF4159 domain-containing protein [Rhodoligotrophos defluvii]|uniref:DUF4159 domain-containing protein n=1 Tax=Rhodoligotrophos defluvii TaxID=2561934 RepID=UPI0010C9C358|nr:DUF4159 domain-containing protein [Rhodoligotrophos defluvii]